MFHLLWGPFYWETCLPALCVFNHLFKLRPHFDRHRVIGYLFICFSQVVLALTPRFSSSLFAQISFRKRYYIFPLSLGSHFPSLNMRRLYQLYVVFFNHFQHRSQVLGSATRCLMGGHQAKLALSQWTVTHLLSAQRFLLFPVAGCWAFPHTPPPFFLSLGFMYFPPKHCFMKRGCSIIFFANLKPS